MLRSGVLIKNIFLSIYGALCLIPLTTPAIGAEIALQGKVIQVLDGDTLDILYQNHPVRIRLNGIDAPEKGMPYGGKAKQFVTDLAAQKVVTVEVLDTDKYDRSIGEVVLPDGRSLNQEIVKAGYAWWYRKYSKDASLGELEEEARKARWGLWRDQNPQPPWEWRVERRGGATSAATNPSGVVSGSYHGNVKSMVFHQSSCKQFNCKNCNDALGSRQEALAAGYRPCGICNP